MTCFGAKALPSKVRFLEARKIVLGRFLPDSPDSARQIKSKPVKLGYFAVLLLEFP